MKQRVFSSPAFSLLPIFMLFRSDRANNPTVDFNFIEIDCLLFPQNIPNK